MKFTGIFFYGPLDPPFPMPHVSLEEIQAFISGDEKKNTMDDFPNKRAVPGPFFGGIFWGLP